MAEVKKSKKKNVREKSLAVWESLSWYDMEKWASEKIVSRGRTYQQQKRVRNLCIAADGKTILATVSGNDKYHVKISLEQKNGKSSLSSQCTCPYWDTCKHAVAAVLKLLDEISQHAEIPQMAENDFRLAKLGTSNVNSNETSSSSSNANHEMDNKIRSYIASKSHDELVDLLFTFSQRHQEVRQEFCDKICIAEKDFNKLVDDTRSMMLEVTSEPAWSNHWDGMCELPNYGPLRQRLETMLQAGLFDELVSLGEELYEDGLEQIEQADDEGETITALGECMFVVFQGLAKANMPAHEKLLYAIDAIFEDGYGILDEAADIIFDVDFSKKDWSKVADVLDKRLKKLPANVSDDFELKYKRQHLSKWLIRSLEHAGRTAEVYSIREREAVKNGNYSSLVEFLIDVKSYDDAIKWAETGIKKTAAQSNRTSDDLLNLLQKIAQHKKQWGLVAAYDAWKFFTSPSHDQFTTLLKSAAKAKCKAAVQKFATEFLETGKSPLTGVTPKTGKIKTVTDWPLTMPDILSCLFNENKTKKAEPHFRVLLDIALAAKDSEAILKWYDALAAKKPQYGRYYYGTGYDDRVAEAVSISHPQRTLEIYRTNVESLLPQADKRNYAAIGQYLKKMKPVYEKLKSKNDWEKLVEELRQNYRSRPRFLDVLDKLDGKTILQAKQVKNRQK